MRTNIGSSMETTLSDGDTLLINALIYQVTTPRRGDIVAYLPNGSTDGRADIKRVIGLPGETDEDIKGIADIAGKISWIARQNPERKGKFNVTVSVSNFVPKPFTPFQWCRQDSAEEFEQKHAYLREKISGIKGVTLHYQDRKSVV